MRSFIGQESRIAVPTRNHGISRSGAVVRLFHKPTRAERKAKVAALKAKRGE